VTAGVFAANAIGHSFAQPTLEAFCNQTGGSRWQKPLCLPCRAEAGIASAESRPLVSWRCDPLLSSRHYSSTQIGADSCDAGVIPRSRNGYAPERVAAYRHRMLVNFLATIVIIVLMATGSWTLDTIISS
jgi:hypothetical protein